MNRKTVAATLAFGVFQLVATEPLLALTWRVIAEHPELATGTWFAWTALQFLIAAWLLRMWIVGLRQSRTDQLAAAADDDAAAVTPLVELPRSRSLEVGAN